MRKLMTICLALAILSFGMAAAQDTMNNDTMKADTSKKAVKVTGKITYIGTNLFDGKATLKLVTLTLGKAPAPEVHLMMAIAHAK